MTKKLSFLALAICTCLISVTAFAQKDKEKGQAPVALQGNYGGVTPEGGEPPSPKAPPAGMQFVTWPGFRITPQGSEVFLQMTGEAAYKQKISGKKIVVTLDKVKVHLKNSLRPINTSRFANTQVKKFRLRALKKDKIALEIELRKKAAPQISMNKSGNYTYLVVAFPPTKNAPEPLEGKSPAGAAASDEPDLNTNSTTVDDGGDNSIVTE